MATGQVYYNAGLIYNQISIFNEAIECFELATDHLMVNTDEEKRLGALIYQGLGAVLNQISKYSEAIDYHHKAIKLFGTLLYCLIYCNFNLFNYITICYIY